MRVEYNFSFHCLGKGGGKRERGFLFAIIISIVHQMCEIFFFWDFDDTVSLTSQIEVVKISSLFVFLFFLSLIYIRRELIDKCF